MVSSLRCGTVFTGAGISIAVVGYSLLPEFAHVGHERALICDRVSDFTTRKSGRRAGADLLLPSSRGTNATPPPEQYTVQRAEGITRQYG